MVDEEKYKAFCKYFDELEHHGTGFGFSDLISKARELNIPLISLTELEEIMKQANSLSELNKIMMEKMYHAD